MKEFFDMYFATLISCFQYDMDVYSKGWIYWWILPVIFYTAFFFIKWTVLTAPLWLPFRMILSGLPVKLGGTKNLSKKKQNDI
jgi:hypothetical protein